MSCIHVPYQEIIVELYTCKFLRKLLTWKKHSAIQCMPPCCLRTSLVFLKVPS